MVRAALKSTGTSGSIAILRADHLGDMILTTPLARTLSEAGYSVTVVGRRAWRDVWMHNPHSGYEPLEEICPDWPRDWRRLGAWLGKGGFTHVLVPYHSRPLLLASFFSGIRRRTCQFGGLLGRLTLHRCLRTGLDRSPRHMGTVWQDFAADLGLEPGSPQPEIFLSDEEMAGAEQLLTAHFKRALPILVVHPFHKGSSCNLPPAKYREVVAELAFDSVCNVVITGTLDDAKAWRETGPEFSAETVWNSCGELSLRQLFAIIARANAMLVPSTGPLHVASAVGCPTVSPFCPHPSVGARMWGNLTPGAMVLSPDASRCPRYKGTGSNCRFEGGPDVSEIVAAVKATLREPDQAS